MQAAVDGSAGLSGSNLRADDAVGDGLARGFHGEHLPVPRGAEPDDGVAGLLLWRPSAVGQDDPVEQRLGRARAAGEDVVRRRAGRRAGRGACRTRLRLLKPACVGSNGHTPGAHSPAPSWDNPLRSPGAKSRTGPPAGYMS